VEKLSVQSITRSCWAIRSGALSASIDVPCTHEHRHPGSMRARDRRQVPPSVYRRPQGRTSSVDANWMARADRYRRGRSLPMYLSSGTCEVADGRHAQPTAADDEHAAGAQFRLPPPRPTSLEGPFGVNSRGLVRRRGRVWRRGAAALAVVKPRARVTWSRMTSFRRRCSQCRGGRARLRRVHRGDAPRGRVRRAPGRRGCGSHGHRGQRLVRRIARNSPTLSPHSRSALSSRWALGCLTSSMMYRHALNASARWRALTPTHTAISPIARSPMRCNTGGMFDSETGDGFGDDALAFLDGQRLECFVFEVADC